MNNYLNIKFTNGQEGVINQDQVVCIRKGFDEKTEEPIWGILTTNGEIEILQKNNPDFIDKFITQKFYPVGN